MRKDPVNLLAGADLIFSEADVRAAIDRLADDITGKLSDKLPLALCVMTGGLYLAGAMLSKLQFPLEVDYVHASRYRGETEGGRLEWLAEPHLDVEGRTILLLDDILDEGHTLAAIRDRLIVLGAMDVKIAVLVEKALDHTKPIGADFVGLRVPNRYVFGCGMDAYGWWRNLPEIRALK